MTQEGGIRDEGGNEDKGHQRSGPGWYSSCTDAASDVSANYAGT